MTNIKDFRIDIPQTELDALHRGLADTRFPEPVPGDSADFSRGMPVDVLKDLVEYWLKSYDWRSQEAALNAFPQYTTEIDGQTIHFVHVKSPEPGAMPLLITHGYPSSFAEFMRIIGPLTDPAAHGGDPADAFHVVIPSVPGFGFSTPLSGSGWELKRSTAAFAELMSRLGYERFAAHGGDLGAGVTGRLGATLPDRVIGTHVNSDRGSLGLVGEQIPMPDHLTDDEREIVEAARAAWKAERGYLDLQAHRPETIAAALTDSPAGQLAWIAEKFQTWTNPAKSLHEAVDRDQLLTNISIYWFTRTGASAARFLYEAAHADVDWVAPSNVPSGWAVFNSHPVMRRIFNPTNAITHWSDHTEGGHFPAMEEPDLLVSDVRAFFRGLRK
ncbi:epoxide hydrolase family protein [Allorhizocola rhizosphaerae]|uniref:epoxide hydrolase family protein n=1 Tax=Allorhizocola rhizosphaerae TaxID=1872709 RepID=UPI000E3CB7F9|nr:epoxide hydrolase family protein [Allorhizocola rhizosphaerae]